MKYKKAYWKWLLEFFNGDEDKVVINFDDPELYKDFRKERKF